VKEIPRSASPDQLPVVPEPEQPAVGTAAPEAMAAPTIVSLAEPVVPFVPLPVAQHPPTPVRRPTHLRSIAVAGVAFLVVAALAFPRHPSVPATDDGAAGSHANAVAPSPPPTVLSEEAIATPVASTIVAPRTVSAPSKKIPVPKREKNRNAESTKAAAPIATPVAEVPFTEEIAAKLPGAEVVAPLAPASGSTGTGGAAPVTITGCLEVSVNHDEFRLTDTEGVAAPRSRSWRTGFLKKRSAPVALVEPSDQLALQAHVGRRVAATGLLTSHDLKVSALRVVGPCN
jgi:hypothetical protein